MTNSPDENPQDPNQQPGQNPGQHPHQTPGRHPYQQPGPDAGSKFGTAPYDPNAVGGPMAEPPKFALLKKLTLVSLAIYVLSGIVSLFPAMDEEMISQQLADQGLAVTEEELSMAVTGALIFAVVSLVIPVILYVVAYLGISKVKNWGRILGTVFAALGTLISLSGLFGVGAMLDMGAIGVISLLLTLAFIAVNIYWFVVAFSKENGEYFAQGRVA